MYKRGFILFCFLGFSTSLFAQEGSQNIKRFNFGAGFNFSSGIDNGIALDFGFLLYSNKNQDESKYWDIKNNFILRGFTLTNDNYIFTLSDKISFGAKARNGLFRFYDYLEGGIGFYSNDSKELYKTPLAFNFGGGFGLDIFLNETVSVFIESGWLEHILDTEFSGGLIFQTGVRLYF
jgi:hypothetical protein